MRLLGAGLSRVQSRGESCDLETGDEKEISWEAGKVRAITTDGEEYQAAQLLIAVPLGVLKAKAGELENLGRITGVARRLDRGLKRPGHP